MTDDNLTVVKVNVKRMQSSQKRLKLIQYFKSQLGSKDLFFLQETHSTAKNEKEWQSDFKGKIFQYLGSKTFIVKNKNKH